MQRKRQNLKAANETRLNTQIEDNSAAQEEEEEEDEDVEGLNRGEKDDGG